MNIIHLAWRQIWQTFSQQCITSLMLTEQTQPCTRDTTSYTTHEASPLAALFIFPFVVKLKLRMHSATHHSGYTPKNQAASNFPFLFDLPNVSSSINRVSRPPLAHARVCISHSPLNVHTISQTHHTQIDTQTHTIHTQKNKHTYTHAKTHAGGT